MSAALPLAPEFPRLLDVYDDGDWVALAFEAIDGRPPALSVGGTSSCAPRCAPSMPCTTPSPPAPSAGARAGDRPGWLASSAAGAELAAMAQPPGGSTSGVVATSTGWPSSSRGGVTRWRGSTLLHCDVRSDNLLVTNGGVVFVDWPHACVGVPVFDLVAWAPSVQLEGGPDPEELLALSASARRSSTPTSWPCWLPPSRLPRGATRCGRPRRGSRRCATSRLRRARWHSPGSGG